MPLDRLRPFPVTSYPACVMQSIMGISKTPGCFHPNTQRSYSVSRTLFGTPTLSSTGNETGHLLPACAPLNDVAPQHPGPPLSQQTSQQVLAAGDPSTLATAVATAIEAQASKLPGPVLLSFRQSVLGNTAGIQEILPVAHVRVQASLDPDRRRKRIKGEAGAGAIPRLEANDVRRRPGRCSGQGVVGAFGSRGGGRTNEVEGRFTVLVYGLLGFETRFWPVRIVLLPFCLGGRALFGTARRFVQGSGGMSALRDGRVCGDDPRHE